MFFIKRFFVHACAWAMAITALTAIAGCEQKQTAKDNDRLVLGMVLEPSGLDPTMGAASAIAEVVLYNVFETLTKIQPDGTVQPLLATHWESSADQKVWTFRLRDDVRFQNGELLTAETVRYAFERAAAADSTNKDKQLFAGFERIETPDAHTVVLHGRVPNPDLPFLLGQATAIIVEPRSAAHNNTTPVGTGPYQLENWQKGASLTLKKWEGYRSASDIALQTATFRFISDAAAQSAALLAGDIDLFARVQVARNL